MKQYFVVSDIHGYYSLLIEALDKAKFSMNDDSHVLVVCGDVIDRGEQPKELIDFLLSIPENRLIMIKGNHEYLIENYINQEKPHKHHLNNGTIRTINDLGISLGLIKKRVNEFTFRTELDNELIFDVELKNKIYEESNLKKLISRMVNYHETRNYIFVHGWIPFDDIEYEFIPNWRQSPPEKWEDATWIYSPNVCKDIYVGGKQIVCGHIHTELFWVDEQKYNKHDIYYSKNFIAIDGKAGKDNPIQVLKLSVEE